MDPTEEEGERVPVILSVLLDAVDSRLEAVIGQPHQEVANIHDEGAGYRGSEDPLVLRVQDL